MKCTLITVPAASGETSLAGFIAKPFSESEKCTLDAMKPENDFTKFLPAVQSHLLPTCRLILVDKVPNPDINFYANRL